MRQSWLVGLLFVSTLFVWRCSPSAPTCTGFGCLDAAASDTPASADTRSPRPDTATTDAPSAADREIVALEIAPIDATLTSVNGSMPTRAYSATGVQRNGVRVALSSGTWSLDASIVGTISASGLFTANGIAGGTALVTVEIAGAAGPVRASTHVTVSLTRDVAAAGTPPDSAVTIESAPATTDATRAAAVLYPLDNVVLPSNVAAPDVQWQGGVAGDLYRVRIAKPHLLVSGYVAHTGASFRYDWVVDSTAWRSVLESDPNADATLSVDRYDATARQVLIGTPITLHISGGIVAGAIYYWAGTEGRVYRINGTTNQREAFMPTPPNRATGVDTGQCLACHTISRDGRTLVGMLADRSAAVFDLTRDLTVANPPTVSLLAATGSSNDNLYGYATLNPDATRMLVATYNAGLGLYDVATATPVAGATGIPQPATQPQWSPDGTTIAYINPLDGGGYRSFGFATSALMIVPVLSGGMQFGVPRFAHMGASLASRPEGGSADTHPTFSPDSRFVVFHHGTYAQSYGPHPEEPGALYIVPTIGGAVVRLDNANAGASGTSTYRPSFSPFNSGGYYWVAFFSRRDYGNAQAGTMGSRRRQLWVSAVRGDFDGTHDPSSVPYWLPGQDTATANMAAFWAPQPCRSNGMDCMVSSECCSAQCLPDPAMPSRFTCHEPPPAMCRARGETCGGTGDCCTGLSCLGNVCDLPPG